jgi:ComF family protein
MLRSIAGVLYPPWCASCRTIGSAPLCDLCLRVVRWIGESCCRRCGRPSAAPVDRCTDCRDPAPAFHRARAAAVYLGPARDALVAFKLIGERRSARGLARAMTSAAHSLAGDVVCFVPATHRSLAARGFNPAEELARHVAPWLHLPMAPLLAKIRETRDQAGLGRTQRRGNQRDAFAARLGPPARVLLVDDVMTTGATADACARTLLAAGAAEVDVLTFARAV